MMYVTQKALTKALIKSIACDQLPLGIVDSDTFRDLLLTAEPKFVISRRSTIRNTLIPKVVQQIEEEMRHQLACLSHVYLTIDLWTNRNMSSFLGITVHFIDATWKQGCELKLEELGNFGRTRTRTRKKNF